MKLEHSFSVPVGVDAAWDVLLDITRIAPCMPGAAIDSVDGDSFTGSVQVKLGPIKMMYQGKAAFEQKDESLHRAVIDARGRDARGNGTAAATITATCTPAGDNTVVDVVTDLNITGKPAQFGRSVMMDVGNKLIGQFADSLADELANASVHGNASTRAPSAGIRTVATAPTTVEPINLFESAGPAILKRLIPVGAVLAAMGTFWVVLRRRRA